MPQSNNPFFSVIIPTYNRRQFLEKAVDSVLGQTFRDFELIIIDDGSSDQTGETIRSLNDKRIVYHYQENHGTSHAKNAGIKTARGEFIAFLDSDDRWAEKKLERTRTAIEEFPSIKIFHTQEVWYKNGKVQNQKEIHKNPSGNVYFDVLKQCCISISTAVVHKNIFASLGTFDETLLACEDYDFWLRATHTCEVKLIPEPLTFKEGGRGDQLSAQWGLDRYRIKALEKMLLSGCLRSDEHRATAGELSEKTSVYAQGALKRGKSEEAQRYQLLGDKYKKLK